MLRNVGSNWALIIVTLAATYVLTPFVIHTLGSEGYGTWTLITAMTGYISLLTLGVPAACVRYLAQDIAEGDTKRMNETIGSCAALYLSCGAIAILIGGGMMMWFSSYHIPGHIRPQALFAFAVMSMTVAAGFFGLLPEGILFAHHDFVRRNMVRTSSVLLRLGLTVALLRLNASLIVMAGIQALTLIFDFSISWIIITRRYPDVRLSLSNFRVEHVKRIFSFSVYVLLLSAGVRLSFETDALVIGAFQGVSAIPAYAVANSLIVSLMDFVIAIAAVVSPMTTKLRAEHRVEDLREMFLKWSKVATALTVVVGLCLSVLGPPFIALWIGPSFERPSGIVLQTLLSSCFFFLPARGVAVPLLMGLGKPKAPALAYCFAGALNLVLSVALVKPLGLFGVALGTAVPNVLFAIFIFRVACRELRLPVGQSMWYVIARSTVGALPILGLLLWCQFAIDVRTLGGIITSGLLAVIVFSVIWIAFVYRDDPYVNVKSYLVRMRGWSRA